MPAKFSCYTVLYILIVYVFLPIILMWLRARVIYLILGAEVSPWGWKLHARLILGCQQAVPIVQGQILKAMWVASSWAN